MKKYLFGFAPLIASGAFANLVQNGSFEDGLNHWSGSGFIYSNADFNAYDATHTVEVEDPNTFNDTSISQNLNLTAGSVYHLSFAFSGDPLGPNSPLKAAEVSVGNLDAAAVYDTSVELNSPTNMKYQFFSADFVAGATNTLTFSGLTGGPSGLVIDKVEVTPAPEPATLAVLGLGASGIIRRRKSR